MMEEVKAILADWESLRVEQGPSFWTIGGTYNGQSHGGTRADPISLAHDLARIAGSPVPVVEPEPVPEPEPAPAPVSSEADMLRQRIAQLEDLVRQLTPAPEPDPSMPPPEVMAEAHPDEGLVELKARLLAEFASLRNMLVGHIPMNEEQLLRLQALEHPKFQTWLQG
jgi:hypothetical protein